MSYKAGIYEAIAELKDRTGSSMIAIKKMMQEKMPKDKKWQNATFLQALKNGVAAGDLIQVKNSFKLSPEYKKKMNKAASAPKKPAASKAKKSKAAAPKKKVTSTKKKAAASTKKTTAPKKKVRPSDRILCFLQFSSHFFLLSNSGDGQESSTSHISSARL